MSSPLNGAIARLRELREAAVEPVADPVERQLAGLPALAAGLGLLALVLAEDSQQLAMVERLLTDLEAESEVNAPRTIALLALVMARQATAASEEVQSAVARLFQESDQQAARSAAASERATARLVGAARLLLLTASWFDAAMGRHLEIGQVEQAARQIEPSAAAALAQAGLVTDQAMSLLAAVIVVDGLPEPAAADPLARAFERAVGAAAALTAGRGDEP